MANSREYSVFAPGNMRGNQYRLLVLYYVGVPLRPRFSSFVIVYFLQEHRMYLIDALVAIHLSQLVLLAVVVEHLDGLIKEDDQSSAQCFSAIIWAPVELTFIKVTYISHLRWTKFDMIDMLIRLTENSACQPLK